MQFAFGLMDEADARTVRRWRYEGPYAVYNAGDASDDVSEQLDRRSPYYSVRDRRGELAGFFNFGSSAYVWDQAEPSLFGDDRSLAVGLGLRPDLTGRGLGYGFVVAGLAFAREQFAPWSFRLFVLTFNERAIRVYERAGFRRVCVFVQGTREFLEMSREA